MNHCKEKQDASINNNKSRPVPAELAVEEIREHLLRYVRLVPYITYVVVRVKRTRR